MDDPPRHQGQAPRMKAVAPTSTRPGGPPSRRPSRGAAPAASRCPPRSSWPAPGTTAAPRWRRREGPAGAAACTASSRRWPEGARTGEVRGDEGQSTRRAVSTYRRRAASGVSSGPVRHRGRRRSGRLALAGRLPPADGWDGAADADELAVDLGHEVGPVVVTMKAAANTSTTAITENPSSTRARAATCQAGSRSE